MKYVFVTGGVISGVGKGIIASSTGLLLKALGYRVTMIKIDPYINVDAGTMAPTEHGEVFVLADGGEVDLDLGNYERYLNITLSRDHSITTGKMYQHIIERERAGDFLGQTVQVIPHLTDAIEQWIERVAKIPVDDSREVPQICVIELGGTLGDIENAPFAEALKQLRVSAGPGNVVHTHVSYIPVVVGGEQKTKPTQQTIRIVRGAGLYPDLVACRCQHKLQEDTTKKIAGHCQLNRDQVLAVHDVSSTYLVPALLESQGLSRSLTRLLNLGADIDHLSREKGALMWKAWKEATSVRDETCQSADLPTVSIALVGKYTSFIDSYMSLVRSLEHAAMACRRKLQLVLVDASKLEPATLATDSAEYEKTWQSVREASGILVPGGFDTRGTEGMVAAIRWARESGTPFLGICLGMQLAVVEFARNVCGFSDATSAEFSADGVAKNEGEPQGGKDVIIYMPELDRSRLGGTMRLGLRPTHYRPGTERSKIWRLYNAKKLLIVHERHRHRYEVDPAYVQTLESNGLHLVGRDETGIRTEVVEIRDHTWFVGVQFHPEYTSKVLGPNRCILGFFAACAGCLADLKAARDDLP
ncbi:CTP synthase [Plectosphaerella plurivora]|uniref:CTP synthase n=1 Tax=Plectosphaerella plurivora TaxID=936078 RepID=A0A9P8V9P9_9PEZI|nr:CTP synthase [Plectosphaerella plurivora]